MRNGHVWISANWLAMQSLGGEGSLIEVPTRYTITYKETTR
jgi:hypothetical protein